MKNSCIFPDCKDNAQTRGLCKLHYQHAYRLVTRGDTTWAKLEAKGMAIKTSHVGIESKNWFLEGKKPTKIKRIREKD